MMSGDTGVLIILRGSAWGFDRGRDSGVGGVMQLICVLGCIKSSGRGSSVGDEMGSHCSLLLILLKVCWGSVIIVAN